MQAAFAFYCGRRHNQAHRAEKDVWATALVLDAQLRRYRDLPNSVRELHQHMTEVDLGGWFRRQEGNIVFALGKHAGRSIAEVAEQQPDYIRWMLGQPILDDARVIIEDALRFAQ